MLHLFTLLVRDALTLLRLMLLDRTEIRRRLMIAEKQIAMYVERGIKPRRATAVEKISLVLLARWHGLRDSIVVVKPATFQKWMRDYTFQRWRNVCRKAGPGRPRIVNELRALVRRISDENPIWTAGRIAKELLLKAGLVLAPNTIRAYMPRPHRGPRGDQRWRTFMRNHGAKIVACDFATVYAPSLLRGYRIFYVLVVMEIGSRKLLHTNVTEHPTALWTLNQLREAIPCDAGYRFLVHDNDCIFSAEVDAAAISVGVEPIRTPFRAPRANAFVERLIGTIRRECLDFIIPAGERHLRTLVREWAVHYNRARPHSSLGPGIPDPPDGLPVARQPHRHKLPEGYHLVSSPVLGGLHHEYRLETIAA